MENALETAAQFGSLTYDWLAGLDPAKFTEDDIGPAREGLVRLREAGDALFLALGTHPPSALERLNTDFTTLRESLPDPADVPEERVAWMDLGVELSPLYEAFALSLKASGGRARHLHPTNYLRSVVHLASGLAMVAMFEFVFTQRTGFLTALAFVVWAWSLEGARRVSPTVNRWCMVFFGPIARDHERYRVNSATWYGTALLVLTVTAWGPAGVLGLLALAVGDPFAGLIGRSYGETRLFGGKSLEGTVAFALAALTVGDLYLLAFHGDVGSPFFLLGLAAVAGVAGAITELLSTRLEDNFTIPVVTGWVCQLVLLLA